ncbi:type II toxin-antitoxin system HicB family antitoxin [Azospirillum sp. RWY-5-1]|uniref:Type II toxin-antitoxin system HicB family antitoxin n=1 Tax=Azospirillum oleiclasticum TaxID=2735135 RepID=A0ABX2TMY2_9PROT|nr:type II toxin-antitoxin system HicB family antitoxin [Azospirillum oleiclasticum]NYZ17826.1 type II toxin-antitoxin system HicB family antitoxin [Azospirillum oleiclasticum]NYZ25042.1 type II toxin-antitoxin system HicB family antitoxin [Azospirillum oleiclasticum]
MQYKGYTASIRFEEEAKLLFGEVVGIADTIFFEADSVDSFIQAFHDAVDDYLAWCAEEGREPDKPFNGRILFRCESDLHKSAIQAAEAKNMTLNQWLTQAVSRQIEAEAGDPVVVRAA